MATVEAGLSPLVLIKLWYFFSKTGYPHIKYAEHTAQLKCFIVFYAGD